MSSKNTQRDISRNNPQDEGAKVATLELTDTLGAKALAAALSYLGTTALSILSDAGAILRLSLRDKVRADAAPLLAPFKDHLWVLSNSPKANFGAARPEPGAMPTFHQVGAEGPAPEPLVVKDALAALGIYAALQAPGARIVVRGSEGRLYTITDATLQAASTLLKTCPESSLLESTQQDAHERARRLLKHASVFGLTESAWAPIEAPTVDGASHATAEEAEAEGAK